MNLTKDGLLEHVKTCLNKPTVYVNGGFMRLATKSHLEYKFDQYPNNFSEERKAYLRTLIDKVYICDCVGLIKSYYWGGIGAPDYEAATDYNTDGFINTSEKVGLIDTLPETPGLGLYQKGHVGVYIGNGEVIECTHGNLGDGVVKTKLKQRAWTKWFEIPHIDYRQQGSSSYYIKIGPFNTEAEAKRWVSIVKEVK